MPSLIPNYIARLRTHSQSTAASSSSHSGSRSNSTAGPSTPGSELVRLAADPLVGQSGYVDQTPRPEVARKIHPDVSALLDENVQSQVPEEDLGPRPPRGRSRSAEQLTRMRADVTSQQTAELQDEQGSDSVAVAPPSPRSPLLTRILSVPLLNSVMSTSSPDDEAEPDSSGAPAHWSTFGRRRPLVSAMGELSSLHRRGSGSKSSGKSKSSQRMTQPKSASVTPTTTRTPSARASTISRTQTAETVPSQPNSPAGTMSSSSKSHSGRSHSVRSRRPPLAHPETILDADLTAQLDPQTPTRAPFHASSFTPSPDMTSPLTARPTLDDSPRTFGRGTPDKSGNNFRSYPGLGSTFAQSSITTPPPRNKIVIREPPATFPQRRRTRSRPTTGSLVSFPSLSHTPPAARTGADVVSQSADPSAGRRLSAAWSAAEAVRDGDGQQSETWPATVSREIVRLSLAGAGTVGRDEVAVGEVGALAEGYTKNATFFGSTGEDRRRFMRAGRRRTNTASDAPAQSSSSMPQQSTLQPAFTVSPPSSAGPSSDIATRNGTIEGGLAPHVSVTAPTPSASPSGSRFGTISDSTPGPSSGRTSQSQGKRKMTDAEDEESSARLKMTLLSGSKGPASNRASDASHAPSSFRQTKRIRLSTPSHSPEHLSRSQSRSSHISPPGSPRSRPPSSLRTLPNNPRTLSQSSIPLRAIISPRPPSMDRRSGYHMRDPSLAPSRRQSTQWAGSARKIEEGGHRVFPLQGYAFILGFLLFPVWWAAAIAPVGWGWGPRAKETQDGKGVWTGEADLEARDVWRYDVAFTWRRRCRIMCILSPVYIILIVLLPVFLLRT